MERPLAQSVVRTVFPLLQPTSTPILNVLSPKFRPMSRRHRPHLRKGDTIAQRSKELQVVGMNAYDQPEGIDSFGLCGAFQYITKLPQYK